MMRGFHFRSPVPIPELGVEAGDSIDYDPSDPSGVYLIRRVPKAEALAVMSQYRSIAHQLPHATLPEGTPRLTVLDGGMGPIGEEVDRG